MTTPTYAVLFKWRIAPGREHDFIAAWTQVTEALRDERGGLGSRLHRAEDGTFVAYAQWADEAARTRAFEGSPIAPVPSKVMRDAIVERLEMTPLTVVADLLVR